MLSIEVDEEKVQAIAYEISQGPTPWDELVWFFAEAELRLRPALADGMLYSEGVESRKVEIDPDLLVDQPSEDEIRSLAEEIANLGPSAQDLHWYIAERRYIFDQVKTAMEWMRIMRDSILFFVFVLKYGD